MEQACTPNCFPTRPEDKATQVRDALATRVRPSGLDDLIDLAIETNNYQREQYWDHRPCSFPSQSPVRPKAPPLARARSPPLPATPPISPDEAMQSFRRRGAGASPQVPACTAGWLVIFLLVARLVQKTELPKQAGVLTSAASSCPPSSRLVLQGKLIWGRESLPLSLLIDSGTEDSFLDETVARQAGVPLVTLPEPKTILDLNRQLLARFTHRTAPVTLLIFGNHRKEIELFIIPSSSASVILGSPWLARHNPSSIGQPAH